MPEPATPPPGLDSHPLWQIGAIGLGLYVLALGGPWFIEAGYLVLIAVAAGLERKRG